MSISIACKKPEEPHLDDLVKKPVRIPGWPKGATMKLELGRKKFFFPTKGKTGLLEMKRIKAGVTCYIKENGEVSFKQTEILYKNGLIWGPFIGLIFGGILGLAFGTEFGLELGWRVGLGVGLFFSLGFGLLIGLRGPEIDFDYIIFNSTNLILFNQFREEIMLQVDKCLPSIKEGQEKEKEIQGRAVEVLREMVAEGEINFNAIKRVRRDLESINDSANPLTDKISESSALPAPPKVGELN